MLHSNRLAPEKVAKNFINNHFPHCDGALLAGSVVRGEATETSDLDIVIFDNATRSSYRESRIVSEWPIELFVHNLHSYRDYFESDFKRARPSLPRMVSEGIILKDTGVIDAIKSEAKELLAKGPEVWSTETITTKRYFITDTLEDFIGCNNRLEGIFIANTLAELVSEFVLRTNRKWIGASKWMVRSLKEYDIQFTEQFIKAFDNYYRNDSKRDIIRLVDTILKPYGGRLFVGFSIGKK
ncbi:nucleotidyltransferase domain-containing protein [Ornithinibacillus sp. BX22]|uniref:Nucleotidyltransferase domain-containing protein n=1 Tax=Ornithinibacillus hominis TaxID=2763055 RepID=A0A923RKA4_9BACI|nr:nucleotidyltransferase domain-containing protein [Ornithinibacillus hominis]MBC5638063.1 nucleotidyltransferase domain-containing protein [Ornithinibacillus hominis]